MQAGDQGGSYCLWTLLCDSGAGQAEQLWACKSTAGQPCTAHRSGGKVACVNTLCATNNEEHHAMHAS